MAKKTEEVKETKEIKEVKEPKVVYLTKGGETLASIASKHELKVEDIVKLNDVKKDEVLGGGKQIILKI